MSELERYVGFSKMKTKNTEIGKLGFDIFQYSQKIWSPVTVNVIFRSFVCCNITMLDTIINILRGSSLLYLLSVLQFELMPI